jgi:hypothetical protein
VRHPADTGVKWCNNPVSLSFKLVSSEYLKRNATLDQNFIVFKINVVFCSIGLLYLEPGVTWTRDFLEIITVTHKEAIFKKDRTKNLVKVPKNLFNFTICDIRHDKDVAVLLALSRFSKASQRCFVLTPMMIEY